MKYLVGIAPESTAYQHTTFDKFLEWIDPLTEFQLDIETNVTEYWSTKELRTIQFGSVCPAGLPVNKHQYLLQWSYLTEDQRGEVRAIVNNKRIKKLIHNASFEYVVLRFHGMLIDNVYDTMLMEKILNGGDEMNDNSLQSLVYSYCNIYLDKEEQTGFDDDILTESKVLYAMRDVEYLDSIRRLQIPRLAEWDLFAVAALENDAVLPFSEITYRGMRLDKEAWMNNVELARPLVKEAYDRLASIVKSTPSLYTKTCAIGQMITKDTVKVNPNSVPQKQALLQRAFPDIKGATKLILNAYISANGAELTPNQLDILLQLRDSKNVTPLIEYLIEKDRDWLIEQEYFVPAGTLVTNFNSTDQVLPIVQALFPRVKNLSDDTLSKLSHPFLDALADYKDNLKLVSTYGQSFIDKHVEPDGFVRPRFNQIVSTGRVSCLEPKLCWAA